MLPPPPITSLDELSTRPAVARLRAEVTSRGGTTEAALRVFEDAGLRATVARALEAAALRGRELAAAHPDPIPNRR